MKIVVKSWYKCPYLELKQGGFLKLRTDFYCSITNEQFDILQVGALCWEECKLEEHALKYTRETGLIPSPALYHKCDKYSEEVKREEKRREEEFYQRHKEEMDRVLYRREEE